MAYSRSGSSDSSSNMRLKTSASRQSRKRRKAVLQLPKRYGRSRHGLPVRAIRNTASTNSRLSVPLRLWSVRLPRQCNSIFAHWASVSMARYIQSVNRIHHALWIPTDPSLMTIGSVWTMGVVIRALAPIARIYSLNALVLLAFAIHRPICNACERTASCPIERIGVAGFRARSGQISVRDFSNATDAYERRHCRP